MARLRWCAPLVAALATLLVPAVAIAGKPLGTPLTGEVLFEHEPNARTLAPQCTANPDGTTSYVFETDGLASGPYPGTYTETVNVTVGPQTIPGSSRDLPFAGDFPDPPVGIADPGIFFNAGAVMRLDATFRIDTADATVSVTGTKTLIVDAQDTGTGACSDFNGTFSLPGFPTVTASGFYKDLETDAVRYTARIDADKGPHFCDSGISHIEARQSYAEDPFGGVVSRTRDFMQTFESDGIRTGGRCG